MLSRQAKHLAIDSQILRFAQNDTHQLKCDEVLPAFGDPAGTFQASDNHHGYQ